MTLQSFFERSYAFQVQVLLGITAGCVLVHAVVTFARGVTGEARERLAFVPRVTLWIAGLVLVPLAGTAFYGTFTTGHLRGFLLLVHVGLGGAFTVLLAVAALAVGAGARAGDRTRRPMSSLALASFWLSVLAGFLTAGSMLVSTLPWLGTDELRAALDLHRYAGLCLVCAGVLFGYSMWLQRVRRS